MRAGLSTIQQTLTPEAASVLNHSIAEASRRNHGQTTPLHVAATLLASPSGFLRQACIKSHPNSSHPLQCRALELCFSVALERLPTAQNLSPGHDPPISNALMAALKRAQAHQRRGCPEQQQQPLLAVKVELEQLIISILDDPSVSRVMREASFSSPAVKATIEQSLSSSSNSGAVPAHSSTIGLGFRAPVSVPGPVPTANRNLYLNPRLQQGSAAQSGQQRNEEVKRVIDILLRNKKRNPVLVGESEPEIVVKELFKRIENKEIVDGALKNVQVIHLGKEFLDKVQIPTKIIELGGLIETQIANLDSSGVILDLGDLKWLVEQPVNFPGAGSPVVPQQQVVSEAGRAAVAEMGKLLGRYGLGSGGRRVWLIGTATCETYLRCQVYHPAMENDWDLQAVPIAARAPLSGMFPRLGSNGILSSSVESLSPLKPFPTLATIAPRRLPENVDLARATGCCPQCMQNYEQELARVVPKEFQKSASEVKSATSQPQLPQWLRNAKSRDSDVRAPDQSTTDSEELMWKQKSQELQKKWNEMCLRLHPGHHQRNIGAERIAHSGLSTTSLYNPNLLSGQPFQPKLNLGRNPAGALQLNPNLLPSQPTVQATNPPESPVRTELVLGGPKVTDTIPEKGNEEPTKDLLSSMPSEPQTKLTELQISKLLGASDIDSFKKLLKGLAEKVWWQQDAASALAATVTQCKLGNGKRRSNGSRGDIWLLFTGPDNVGKKKMAEALSDVVYGTIPIMVSVGSWRDNGDSDLNFRGKTAVDRIVEAVKRNPFSVIMLNDIDEANMLVRGSIKHAMERGRLTDSHGREISLGSIIFILTANWLPDNLKFVSNGISLDENKLASSVNGGWQLRLSLSEKMAKRRANWLPDEDRPTKPKKDSGSALSFDLNEVADAGDDKTGGSHNSSDVTIDHEDEQVLNNRLSIPSTSSVSRELLNFVDDNIVFRPVDIGPVQQSISNSITKKFSTIISEGISMEIQTEALEKIIGGVWLGQTGIDDWIEKALVPSLHELKSRLPTSRDASIAVRLELDSETSSRSSGDWLPSNVKVVVGEL